MNSFFVIILLGIMGGKIAYGHVVDIHVKTPAEIADEERQERERENDRDRNTYEDDSKEEQERYEALGRLNDKEEVV